ncbi:hypothetical protein EXIGLDRAFT_828411 [Exidia glandulosa HHB12029]|uniref:Transmembrane protein n=1 Tax=Exidia glandulosa HHB12029 TaxID=1314781 RepID=A0A166BRW4_EXIGL|nr:hypothetical protein EXIGLDRAFT_828411 [Exidia glandulosa HHB12029]
MPQTTITLDDTSPLIRYSGNWRTGNNPNSPDAAVKSYYGSTFTMTTDNAATATLQFYGPGTVSVYGAKRFNHGPYNVTLDGTVYTGDGFATKPELYKQRLFAKKVTEGAHTLRINDAWVDDGRKYLDIDYIQIVTDVGAKTLTADSSDKAFVYAGAGWQANDAGRVTGQSGDSVTIPFTGDSIEVYGLVGGLAGVYTVSLDGQGLESYSAYNQYHWQTGQLLYMARGLEDGPHTVTLTNTPTGQGQNFALARASVHGANPAVGTVNTANSIPEDTDSAVGDHANADDTTTGVATVTITVGTNADGSPILSVTESPMSVLTPGASSGGLSRGAMIGAVISVVLTLILTLLAFICVRKRRKSYRRRKQEEYATMIDTTTVGTAGVSSSGSAAMFPVGFNHAPPHSPTISQSSSTVMGGIDRNHSHWDQPQLSEKQRLRLVHEAENRTTLLEVDTSETGTSEVAPSAYSETDAGVRRMSGETAGTFVRREDDFGPFHLPEVLPPDYLQATRRR